MSLLGAEIAAAGVAYSMNLALRQHADGRSASDIPSREPARRSSMLREAGFKNIAVKPTFGYWSIVTGVKT
jgi:hypothetical protein